MADLFAMPPEAIPDLLFNGDFVQYVDFLPNPAILDEIVHALRRDGDVRAADLDAALRPEVRAAAAAAIRVPTLVVGAEDDWLDPERCTPTAGPRSCRTPGSSGSPARATA